MTRNQRIELLAAINSIEDFDGATLMINGIIIDLTNLYFEIDEKYFELRDISGNPCLKIYFKYIFECWIFDGNSNENKELLKLKCK